MNKKLIGAGLCTLLLLLGTISSAEISIDPAGTGAPFIDTNILVYGSSDSSKAIRFEVDTNVPTSSTVVLTAPAASGTLVTTAANQTFSGNITFTGTTTSGRHLVSGFTPSCTATVSNATGAIQTGSTDEGGYCVITCGTSCGQVGTVTITFSTGSTYGSSATPVCVATLASGTGNWQANATVIQTTLSTTAPVFSFTNAQTGGTTSALSNGATYLVGYICFGRP